MRRLSLGRFFKYFFTLASLFLIFQTGAAAPAHAADIDPNGAITINPEPSDMNTIAPWTLTGSTGVVTNGTSGYERPTPGQVVQTLTEGQTLTFTGTYLTSTGTVFISVNFDNAKVVYIDENHILKKINNQGLVSSVLNTDVAVSNILSTEQGNLFIVFQSPQLFDDGYSYLLAKAVPTTNTISGIDKDLLSIIWNVGLGLSPGVQSDSSGNLYYLASQSGKTVLKKCKADGSNIVNLINDNIVIDNWLVRADGTILLGGTTQSTDSKWLRKLTPENNLSSLAVGTYVRFLLDFPDNRVYSGIWGSTPYFGVYKLPVSLTSIDAYTPYIGDPINDLPMMPEYSVNSIISGHNSTYVEGFRGYYGTYIQKMIKTDSGRTIILAGYGSSKTLVQYYPTPEIIELTLIDKPTLIEKMSHLLLIAGTKNGVNKLVLYDPETSSEISLLNEDIEIYHLTSLYDGYVWLDGLKFNGNRYVVGKIQITINPASLNQASLEGVQISLGSFQEMSTLSAKPNDLVGLLAQPEVGSLTVTITPQGVINAGGLWRRTGTTTWLNGGATETAIPVGFYTVEFKDVMGWTTPSTVAVTISYDQTQTITGTYVQQTVPIIQVTPSSLNFGYVPPGSYKDLALEVKNIGAGTLTGTVSATPPFSIVSGGSYSLGANQTKQFVVRYTAPLEEGSQTGSLIFTGGGGITIQVKGTNKKAGLPWLMLLLGD